MPDDKQGGGVEVKAGTKVKVDGNVVGRDNIHVESGRTTSAIVGIVIVAMVD